MCTFQSYHSILCFLCAIFGLYALPAPDLHTGARLETGEALLQPRPHGIPSTFDPKTPLPENINPLSKDHMSGPSPLVRQHAPNEIHRGPVALCRRLIQTRDKAVRNIHDHIVIAPEFARSYLESRMARLFTSTAAEDQEWCESLFARLDRDGFGPLQAFNPLINLELEETAFEDAWMTRVHHAFQQIQDNPKDEIKITAKATSILQSRYLDRLDKEAQAAFYPPNKILLYDSFEFVKAFNIYQFVHRYRIKPLESTKAYIEAYLDVAREKQKVFSKRISPP